MKAKAAAAAAAKAQEETKAPPEKPLSEMTLAE
jgi:hypothetical protein